MTTMNDLIWYLTDAVWLWSYGGYSDGYGEEYGYGEEDGSDMGMDGEVYGKGSEYTNFDQEDEEEECKIPTYGDNRGDGYHGYNCE